VALLVLSAVNLNRKLARRAGEVGDVPTNEVLPSKFPGGPAFAKSTPKLSLCVACRPP
jgi:hypothetical protein